MKSAKFLAVLRANNQKRVHLQLTDETMQQIRTYHAQGYTKGDMCKLFGVGMAVINRCFRDMGIQGRGGARNILTPRKTNLENTALFRAQQLEPLIRESFKQGLSSVDVGKFCGIDYSTILDYARLLGIPVQTRQQAAMKRRGSLAIVGILREVLDGELLGDGCLVRLRGGHACFSYGTPRAAYLAWLATLLESYGLIGNLAEPWISTGTDCLRQPIFRYCSRRYPELTDLYLRWYPDGKKRIPADLCLTPIVCRHWYIGDGTFKRQKPTHRPCLSLATQAFTFEEVYRLQEQLAPLFPGTHVGRQEGQPVLQFRRDATEAFLQYIGPCPEPLREVYGYKWGLPKVSLEP